MSDLNNLKKTDVKGLKVVDANIVDANIVTIDELLVGNKSTTQDNIDNVETNQENNENIEVKKRVFTKRSVWIPALTVLILVVSTLIGIKVRDYIAQADVAIGDSHTVKINLANWSGNNNQSALKEPILYITLDTTGQGLPTDYDDTASNAEQELADIAKAAPNHYGAYLPSFDNSSIIFIPYTTAQVLGRSAYVGSTSRDAIRNKVTLLSTPAVGAGEFNLSRKRSDLKRIQTHNADIRTDDDLKSKLGSDIFTKGVYYHYFQQEGFNVKDWNSLKGLVTPENIEKSLILWNYFTDFSNHVHGNNNEDTYTFVISERINKYLYFGNKERTPIEKSYKTLDLLLTVYSLAKDSGAAESWKNAIVNYVKNNGVSSNGAAKGANILVHTGTIYNNANNDKYRGLYFMSHADAINYTMGIMPAGNMSDKNPAYQVVLMKLSKQAGLISTSSHNFNQRLREAYGISVKEKPNAVRTAWSGDTTTFGSIIVNYFLEKRPKKDDWKVLEDRYRPYIKRLYVPIYNVNGSRYETTYGMNAILAFPWIPDEPDLTFKAEVEWAKKGDDDKTVRTYELPLEQATINRSAIFKFKFTTKDISAWTALSNKYSSVAIALTKVDRTLTKQKVSDKTYKKSTIQNMQLQVAKKAGETPTNYTLGTYVRVGKSKDFVEQLKNKQLSIDIFSDASYINQAVNYSETISQMYEFEVRIMFYNGTLDNLKETYVYGDKDPKESEVLIYKATTDNIKKKLTVTAKKDKPQPTDPPPISEPPSNTPTPSEEIPEEKVYEYREFVSEPLAYAEIKEGTINLTGTGSVETYEAMAGVPSTERLYFTSGGSEFIVEIYLQRIVGEESQRKYTSWFRANTDGSEFKETDSLKGGRAKYTKTETFVADADGKNQSKSVVAEISNIEEPVGASTANVTVNAHTSDTTISAEWTGTISNNTPEPADIGKFDPGKPGDPCAGNTTDLGTQRTKGDPQTNWAVDSYNQALQQAIDWAKKMEATNNSFTVQRIADSDGQIRQWLVGEAVITITMSGGSNGYAHTVAPSFSKNGVYKSSTASGAFVQSNDVSILGSGWGWTDGKLGVASGYVEGCGHNCTKEWDEEPRPARPPSGIPGEPDYDPGEPAFPGKPHSHTHRCGSYTPGVDIQQGASGSIQYSIKVTFKNSKTKSGGNYDGDRTLPGIENVTNGVLKAHALCGPDCQHNTLPAVYDTWVQYLKYDYLRINAIKVYKISRSYVDGMEKITFDETENIIANIRRGDPNIFYNIAEECPTYSSDEPETPSLAGRVRYSLQSQQHDEVVWRERSSAGDMRTRKSDGMAKTKGGNAVPSGGTGHKDQSWANGILYSNPDGFTDDEKWFDTIFTSEEKSGYTEDSIDAVDKETEEFKRFKARRETENTVQVISDMLILQTSTGDQSVLYFTKSQKVKAQEHFGQKGELSATMAEMWDNNPNSAAKWKSTAINIGGYTGKFSTPYNKFSSGSKEFKTVFDSNGSDFDATSPHPDPDATVDAPKTYSTVANVVDVLSDDNYKSSPAKMQRRMTRVSYFKTLKDGIQQNPINPNQEYVTGNAYQFYQPILEYTREELEDPNREEYEFEYESEFNDVLGYSGYSVDAVYGPGLTKVNNIVVHTPVSAQNAAIVALSKDRDQRTELGLSSAESLIDLANGLNHCPGTPDLCEYRYLNCKYFQDVTLLSLNFNPKSTIAVLGEDGKPKEIETVREEYDEDGNKKVIVVDTVKQLEYELPPGFEIDKTNRFGTGDALKAYGTRLSIPLSDLGIEYKASNRIQVEFNLYIPPEETGGSAGTMLVSFNRYDFYLPTSEYGTWNTGNGIERRVDGVNFKGQNLKIKLIFSMVDVDACELYVNGTKIDTYTRVGASKPISQDLVGDYINIGCWNYDDKYPAKFYIDNFVITKLAGTHTHDESCYTTVYNHQKFVNYTCQTPITFNYKGEPEIFTAPVSGWYKLEAWGAAGGGGTLDQTKSSHGGLGGYASGKVYLTKGQKVLITAGGQGTKSTALGTGGGYNGGGHGGPSGYGGGGATDIIIEGYNRSLLTDNQLNINNWSKAYSSAHTTVGYSNGEGRLKLTTTTSAWEHYYIPVYTKSGTTYEFSFQYRTEKGLFKTLSYKDALYVGATTSQPASNSDIASWLGFVKIVNLNTTTYNKYSYTFKGTGGLVYLDFNFGCYADGTTDTIYIKDMRLVDKDTPNEIDGGTGVYTLNTGSYNGVYISPDHIYGPYISAPKGIYRVDVYGSNLNSSNVTVDAYTNNGVYYTTSNLTVTSNRISFYANITKDIVKNVDGNGLEFRVWGLSNYTFTKMVVARLDDRVLVAGGGGGADNDGGNAPIGGVDDGSGGHGGGLVGGNAYINGSSKSYTGGGTVTDLSDLSKWNIATGLAPITWDETEQAFKAVGHAQMYVKSEYAYPIDPNKTYTIKVTVKVANYGGSSFYWGGNRLDANRQHLNGFGGTYDYSVAAGKYTGNTGWVTYTATKTGTSADYAGWGTDTAYYALGGIFNYSIPVNSPNQITWVKNIELYEDGVLVQSSAGPGTGCGQSVTKDNDAGGAGAGYYGGLVTNHGNGGGGGGSSYIAGVTDGVTVAGVNAGHGKARITLLDHVHTGDCKTVVSDYNVHIHNKNCITADSSELVNALRMAEKGDHSELKRLLGNTVYELMKKSSSTIYTWSGWTTTDYKLFTEHRNTKLSVTGNNLKVSSTGYDPSFEVPVKLQAGSVEKIRVYARLVGTTSTYSDLFFKTDTILDYVAQTRVMANINPDNNWQWIEFNVASNNKWSGEITGLRFDLVGNDNSNGYVEINKIELVGSGSASAGTATTILQTYDNFAANTRQFGITNPGSTATLSFSGGNIVLNGRMSGWEINLPVEIDNGKALQFVRLTLVNQTPATTAEIRLNGNDSYKVSANITANSTATQVAVFKVPEYTGKITSIQFSITDHASGGSAKISKIELIGYGKRTADPTESFVNGEYDAHIHTQDCRYTPGEEVVGSYTPVALTKQHHTSNGGYTPATGWDSFTSNPGDPQRMYNGENIVSLVSPIEKNSYVRIEISNTCLSHRAYYYNFQIKINGEWMTLQDAQNKGYIHSAWVENKPTTYTPHPSPNNILTGGNVGVGTWSGLYIYIYTGKTFGIEDVKVSAYYYDYGGRWNGMSKPGDGIWVKSGKLPVTNKDGEWTTCTGVLNTYSDLVTEVTPVKRETAGGNITFNYTGEVQTFTAPLTGTYTLEVWGAQGGNLIETGYAPYSGSTYGVGGKGGYSKGTITLNEGETLYIYVGGKGNGTSGGWNGGGTGRNAGAGGGGATDIRKGGTTLDKRIIVAGGGGGAQYGDGGAGGGTYGMDSPKTVGGNSTSSFWGTPGTGGGQTLSTGSGQWGVGQDARTGTDNLYGGAGGGGYVGGGSASSDVSRVDDYGGAGGSGYIGGVEDGTTQTGVRSGNGMAKITWWGETYYTGPDYVAPPNRQKYTYTPVKIAYSTPTAVSTLTAITFGSLNGTYEGIVATINTISNYYNQIPQTIGGRLNPIFSCREVPNVHQCVDECNKPEKIFTCREPHHYGAHYDMSNPICWDACGNDSNHKIPLREVTDLNGNKLASATFINTDYEFQVYFPNTGDFYESDLHGIEDTTHVRGKGYTYNMDTTKWIREKRIMFTFDVLFYNEGVWEQHLANTWIELPVTGATYPYYRFYCTLNNNERAAASVYYEVEAINADPSPGGKNDIYARDGERNNDNFDYVNNAPRFYNLTAYHGAYKKSYVDLVGRIGNLLITDTDDMRFSNFFKRIKADEWIVKGIINAVYPGDQVRYMSWHSNNLNENGEYVLMTDIRGVKVSKETGMYNTWGTQAWTAEAEAKPLPVSAEKNNIVQLQDDPLKPGYDVLFEISTLGDYNIGLQIVPYFYALNVKTNQLEPVDVWARVGNEYKVINIHRLADEPYYWDIIAKNNIEALRNITDPNWIVFKDNQLFDYAFNLDWINEQERRNYDMDEQLITEKVALTLVDFIDKGNETVIKLTEVPFGNEYAIGTLQLLNPKGRARTFIGSENTNTANINGGTLTNIAGLINSIEFNVHAQRWHLKLGLPSSAIFTTFSTGKHYHPTDIIEVDGQRMHAMDKYNSDDWVILMTADIKAIGNIWNLKYSQGNDNGIITVNGKTIALPAEIPTVIAVYDSGITASMDVDIIGTH